MITEDGTLKVTDFGVAKMEAHAGLTEDGSVLGTMAYMAPEQILGEAVDQRADIFSFGVLLYELSAGELPFQGFHRAALSYEILNSPAPSLADLRGDLPEEFQRLVSKVLEKRPQDRFERLDQALETLVELRDRLRSGSASDPPSSAASSPRELQIGQTFGHYRLLSKIGEGGMGLVYRARDTRLDRQVALKTLKAHAVMLPERKKRFIQEAKAASALNHPNIVTIHEIGEYEGVNYIAMEYVSGDTLAIKIGERALGVSQVLRFGAQITDALASAHQVGIVHRDLKPANMMVTEEGRIKLLDFGLAKLTENDALSWSGVSTPETQEGAIVGTVAYMSPEQAEGRPVDARSDVFSFGAVLYEMATGRKAFDGDSKISILAAIVQQQPMPVSEVAPSVPHELERIISRCLRKGPERRFQHMADLRVALEDVLEDWETGRVQAAAGLTPKSRKKVKAGWRDLALAACGGALLAAGIGWLTNHSAVEPPPADVSLSQLTGSEGLSINPSWSPDGASIVYASDYGGNMDLWTKPTDGGEEIQLTETPEDEVQPAWSPDGRSIAFSVRGSSGGIFLMPSAGGQAVRVTDFGAYPRWSPDGQELAFDWNGTLYAVAYSGGDPEPIVSGTSGSTYHEWSPDGRSLVYWDRTHRDLFVVSRDGEAKRKLSLIPTGEEVAGIAYANTGSTLVFAKGAFGGDKDLWQVELDPDTGFAAGPARRLSVSATDDVEPRFSPDGKRLAFTVRRVERQFWGLELDPKTGLLSGDSHLITFSGQRNYYPTATPDGSLLAWTSQNAGQGVIHYRTPDDDEGRKLTRDWDRSVREIGATIAPDGVAIAYSSTVSGAYQIWRTPAPDSVALQVTRAESPFSDAQPTWSPDGEWFVFYSNREDTWDIWLTRATGESEPTRLTDWEGNELYPAWSPDGRYVTFSADRAGNPDIWRLEVKSGDIVEWVAHPAVEGHSAWSPDGKRFYFSSNRSGEFEIWMMPAQGGEAQMVTASQGGALGLPETALYTKFAITNSELIAPLENRRGDIYMLENLQ